MRIDDLRDAVQHAERRLRAWRDLEGEVCRMYGYVFFAEELTKREDEAARARGRLLNAERSETTARRAPLRP